MKVCPECNAHYEDSMFFCLEDGQPLRSGDSPLSSNPATFEKTAFLPADEKTLNLSPQNELTGEKTLNLPAETATEETPAQTVAWQPETLPPQPFPKVETNQNIPLGNYQRAEERGGKGKFIVVGGLLGGIALLGTALGGWWLLSGNSTEVAVANVKKQTENANSDPVLSNVNLSGSFAGDNTNVSSNLNSNLLVSNTKSAVNTNLSVNSSAPKNSPLKENKESPTPTTVATSTPQTTPIPKAPTSTLTSTPTPTPESTRTVPKIVSAGVVNGKAISLVRPPYPPAAKAVGASGAVNVQVLIDENGNVVRASAVSGHPLLRSAAEAAARSSKFSPTVLSGQAVKVTGVVVYNFTP